MTRWLLLTGALVALAGCGEDGRARGARRSGAPPSRRPAGHAGGVAAARDDHRPARLGVRPDAVRRAAPGDLRLRERPPQPDRLLRRVRPGVAARVHARRAAGARRRARVAARDDPAARRADAGDLRRAAALLLRPRAPGRGALPQRGPQRRPLVGRRAQTASDGPSRANPQGCRALVVAACTRTWRNTPPCAVSSPPSPCSSPCCSLPWPRPRPSPPTTTPTRSSGACSPTPWAAAARSARPRARRTRRATSRRRSSSATTSSSTA